MYVNNLLGKQIENEWLAPWVCGQQPKSSKLSETLYKEANPIAVLLILSRSVSLLEAECLRESCSHAGEERWPLGVGLQRICKECPE